MTELIKSSLFRPEAVEASSTALASPMGIAPPTSWALSWFFASICIATLIFISVGTYARKETVRGIVRPATGLPVVIAPRAGMVMDVRSADGNVVKKGQVLFVLSSEQVSVDGKNISSLIKTLRKEEAQSQQGKVQAEIIKNTAETHEMQRKLLALDSQLQREQGNLEVQQEKLKLAQSTLDSVESLYAKQLLAEIEYKRYKVAILDTRIAIHASQAQVSSITMDRLATATNLERLLAEKDSLRQQLRASKASAKEQSISLDQEAGFPSSAVSTRISACRG